MVSTLPLLVLVDIIDASACSRQSFVGNKFGLAHFLNVLFGYQAAPSMAQVMVNVLALLVPLVFLLA